MSKQFTKHHTLKGNALATATVEALEQAANTEAILETLFKLGGGQFNVESDITYHEDETKAITLPKGMRPEVAATSLMEFSQAQKEMLTDRHVFDATPGDGAYCMQQAIKKVLGISGIGKPVTTFFGTQHPETISVRTGLKTTVRVPWGVLSIPPLQGQLETSAVADAKYGYRFQIIITTPKRFEKAVAGLIMVIADEIEKHSIYIGKCFAGVGLDINAPARRFIDPYLVNRHEVVYTDDVFRVLDSEIWGVIRSADLLQAKGKKINTKHLLYGPYGTGKTLAGMLTAQVCMEEGWTFIQCNTGTDDLEQVVRWAELYGKSSRGVVVFVEDIDTLLTSETDDPIRSARMKELFDGMSAKNNRVMMVMTSNRVDAVDTPFSRSERFDNMIEIGSLDRDGVERLLHALFGDGRLSDDIDFTRVYDAMTGYEPAFIRGSFERVERSALVRLKKANPDTELETLVKMSEQVELTTDDFVNAAVALRKQWEIHSQKKAQLPKVKDLEAELGKLVATTVEQTLSNFVIEDWQLVKSS